MIETFLVSGRWLNIPTDEAERANALQEMERTFILFYHNMVEDFTFSEQEEE